MYHGGGNSGNLTGNTVRFTQLYIPEKPPQRRGTRVATWRIAATTKRSPLHVDP